MLISGKLYNALMNFTAATSKNEYRETFKKIWYANGCIYGADSYKAVKWELPLHTTEECEKLEKTYGKRFHIVAKHKPSASTKLELSTDDFNFISEQESGLTIPDNVNNIFDGAKNSEGVVHTMLNPDFVSYAVKLAQVISSENGTKNDENTKVGKLRVSLHKNGPELFEIEGGALGKFESVIMPIRE